MPGIKKIEQTMVNLGIPNEILEQFDFTESSGSKPEPVITLMDKMDELLTPEQCLSVMQEQGCCKGGKRDKDCKAFAKKHSQKSVGEKLALMSEVENMMSPQINDDGTFTITMKGYQNGIHEGKTTCSCGMIKKLRQPFSVSPTYCGCCAGHFRYHYQNMLGVSLKLKEIVSSPLNTNSNEPCSFTFEIEKKPTLENVAVYASAEDINNVNMFINLAKSLDLKGQINYAKPNVIELNAGKSYKCVFTSKVPKRVIFTLSFSNKHFSLKANLYDIDKYKDCFELTDNIFSQMRSNAWDCAWYNGGTCSDKCRRGVPLTLNGKPEYKCIGGAFTFNGLTDSEWQQVAELIKIETERIM